MKQSFPRTWFFFFFTLLKWEGEPRSRICIFSFLFCVAAHFVGDVVLFAQTAFAAKKENKKQQQRKCIIRELWLHGRSASWRPRTAGAQVYDAEWNFDGCAGFVLPKRGALIWAHAECQVRWPHCGRQKNVEVFKLDQCKPWFIFFFFLPSNIIYYRHAESRLGKLVCCAVNSRNV